ncbi:ORF6C domain-containing protein [Enterococcus sp. JM9B]|uniref:ORF6C domain-containing protein n=1 Tax=Enterococcus sp. JM9B TaxID=1857216 RepID=UPI001374E6AC|nr:ORF6C domain-containing protein [Enterococcus sp. JM9B]KAF1303709.1 hypothetical protein BAU16_03850 [Enterococcus sp. JM9B]
MDNQLTKNDPLIFTLERQNKQGEALVAVLKEVRAIENRVDKRVSEAEALLDKMSKQVTITYEEQREITSLIHCTAGKLARKHEQVLQETFSDNLFKAWKGLFVRRMHSKLKERMNVARYTSIERVNYDEATAYLKSLSYVSFSSHDLEPTPGILKVLELEESK